MASLFDQYEQFASSSGTGSSAAAGSGGGGGASSQANKNEGIINLRTNVEEPIFAKNKIDFKPPNPITHMLVSSNQLLMAMENRTLLKIDLMDPSKKTEIDLNAYLSDKSKPVAISGIFLDPTGRHCIISLYLKQQQTQQQQNTRNSSSLSTSAEPPPLGSRVPYENFYYNKKLHKLTKLNGFVITAVGWNAGSSSSDQQSTTTGTGSILIGTSDGRIFETALQPDDRFLGSRELFLKQVADLPDSISGSGSGSGSSGQLFSGSSSQQMTSGTSPVPPPAGASSISEPICGLNVFKLPTTKGRTTTTTTTTFCVLAATSNFLYQYIGEVSAQQMQATSSSSSLTSSSSSSETAYLFHVLQSPSSRLHKEMPGAGPASRLDLYHPPPPPAGAGAGAGAAVLTSPKAFGWLTKPGIFFHDIPADLNGRNAARLFDDASMLMLSDLMTTTTTSSSSSSASTSSASNEAPISLVLTKFHLLLLYPSRLKVVCRLNQAVILEDRFSGTYGRVLGLCRDPIRGTVWAYAEHAVYRYKIVQEERNIWEIYLKKRDFAAARLHAGDDLLKQDRTVCEEALHLFSVGDYRASAALFAGARSRSFEEIALKFIELGGGGNGGGDPDQEALKEYLLCKLRTLSPVKERTQVIILLLWLLEISLNQLGRLANRMEDAELSNQEVLNLKVEYNRVEANLKGLISNSNYKAVLKKNRHIAYNLLLAHNAQSVLIYFAETMDDFERLLEHYLAQGELDQALTILRKEECLALYYRYSPVIVQERPRELVAQLMPLAKGIDFAKLIPALVHFDNGGGDSVKEPEVKGGSKQSSFTKRELQCLEILRFLEYCVFSLETDSSLVHNYLIALYAQYQPDKLLTYLQIKGGGGVGGNESGGGGGELDASSLLQPALPYDVRYAARLCTQLGLGQATVHLLATMGSIEEAVEQALADGDVELAKTTAERVSAVQRPEMAKRLWLKIAKHVIKKSSSSTEDGANSSSSSSSSDNFNLKMATDLLNECPLLKIEDILPYFPAFSTIDHFKEAICSSLEEYNRTIETLREDMKVATESAAEIREEIRRLRSRYTLISATADRCALCEYAVLSKAFYAFNCGHLFHSDCLLDEVRPHLPPAEKRRLEELERSLMRPSSSQQQPAAGGSASNLGGSNGGGSTATAEAASIAEANRREEVYAAIDDLVASECLYCGHHMIASIDKPFIDPEETNALKGWD